MLSPFFHKTSQNSHNKTHFPQFFLLGAISAALPAHFWKRVIRGPTLVWLPIPVSLGFALFNFRIPCHSLWHSCFGKSALFAILPICPKGQHTFRLVIRFCNSYLYISIVMLSWMIPDSPDCCPP